MSQRYTPYRARPARGSRCCCMAAAALFAAAIGFFCLVVCLALWAPTRPPEVQKRRDAALERWSDQPPRSPAPEARALKDRMELTRDQATRAARSTGRAPFEITMTEDEVNALFATEPDLRAELERQGVRDLTVLFERGRMLLDATVTRGGLTVSVSADAVPIVRSDGTLDVRVEGPRAGRFPIPPSLLDEARRALAEALASQDPRQLRLESVSVSPGTMTVRGQAHRDVLERRR